MSIHARPGRVGTAWYCTSVPLYQAFCMSKQCCTRKNWYVPKKFLVQGPFWFSVRSSVPSRRLCAVMAHENERIARENETNEARGDEGARPGFRRSEASPNWDILSRSGLFVTRHASWRSVVRVSNTRHVDRSAIDVLVHGRRRTSRRQGARRAIVATMAHQVQPGSLRNTVDRLFYL